MTFPFVVMDDSLIYTTDQSSVVYVCVIRCGAWSLFWLWLPFNMHLQSL